MIIATLRRVSHVMTSLVMVLALATLGFGHQIHAEHASLDPDVVAFLNAGGDLSDFCGEGTSGTDDLGDCPVCQLTLGFAVPDLAAQQPAIALHASNADWTQTRSLCPQHRFDAAHQSRAPPRA
ncbi:MAG: hypothetical protein AAF231_03540 [Pseudomonadota bacterium]